MFAKARIGAAALASVAVVVELQRAALIIAANRIIRVSVLSVALCTGARDLALVTIAPVHAVLTCIAFPE